MNDRNGKRLALRSLAVPSEASGEGRGEAGFMLGLKDAKELRDSSTVNL